MYMYGQKTCFSHHHAVHKLPEVQHQPQETNKKHAAAALTTAVGENGTIAHQTCQPALGQSGIVDEPCRSRQVLQLARAAGRKTVTVAASYIASTWASRE